MTAADPRCQRCAGKGSVSGQRCDCVDERLRQGLELPLLFHSGGDWDNAKRLRWREITGSDEANTRVMCDHIRELLED